MATIILGTQWGDEGKGKLTDILINEGGFQLCARAAGGVCYTTLIIDIAHESRMEHLLTQPLWLSTMPDILLHNPASPCNHR
ncbi:hypothetical protein GGR58DRAFT_457534 [Xylaria digitata]|nr:hypothetical protein GGR58DRAFT_457534 [Xylaria digitata]